ncbi:hypothetical protein C8R46DRAFT_1344236 [Mycena filopes]|nr:hypothetical protein C8R46DRAFT_1344236 [Mycena filopes]
MLKLSPELFLDILHTLSVPLGFQIRNEISGFCISGETIFQTQQNPDRATLASCSLVCRSWAAPSQRLLFQRVEIEEEWESAPWSRRPDRLQSFLGTITTESDKSHWLRDSVLSILLRPRSSTKSGDLLAILTHLPNLRELDINGAGCLFSDIELAHLQKRGPTIRSLRVTADHTDYATSQKGLHAIMKFIPAIPTIRMLDITANTTMELPPISPPLHLQLVSFKLHSKYIADASAFVASLGDAPLEVFHETQSLSNSDFEAVLCAHGNHLRSLSMQGSVGSFNTIYTPRDPSLLRFCTQLERFEYRSPPSDTFIAAIPRTITVLSVMHLVRVLSDRPRNPNIFITPDLAERAAKMQATIARIIPPITHLIAALETFPSLRVFSWVTVVGAPAHPEVTALEERCKALGIKFCPRTVDSLSDDEVESSLRRRLLAL